MVRRRVSVRGSSTGRVRVRKTSDKKLQNLKRTYRSDSVIIGAVERHVVTQALSDGTREAHAIHPSEICHKDTCHRQIYYRIVDTPPDIDGIDVSFWKERVFEEGHDIHAKWQGWLWDMGKLYGYYECLVCDAKWYGRAPTECQKCHAHRKKLRYREVPILNDNYMLVGHADGMIDEGLLEVKSIGLGTVRIEAPSYYDRFMSGEWNHQQLWNEIKRPFPTHIRQGMLYSFCQGMRPVIFIYECKWNQAIKEFTVQYTEEVIAPVLGFCLDIKYAVKKRKPLPRPKWADPEHVACKACPYRRTCYGEVQGEAATGKRWRVKTNTQS